MKRGGVLLAGLGLTGVGVIAALRARKRLPSSSTPAPSSSTPAPSSSTPAPSSSTPAIVFPVRGKSNFSDTWHAPREGGKRIHEGIDIFADEGTPVVAAETGELTHGEGKLGGHFAHVTTKGKGPRYYYAHLSRYEGEPRHVVAGEVIGYVGRTGNAATTPPHLHFEIRQDGEAINPFPALAAAAPPEATFPAGVT